jgi:predicted Zn-dependent protease with MMP-like domain
MVQEAFDQLSEEFQDKIDNIQIVVEDYPDDETQRDVRASKTSLLGLYQGIPYGHRGTWYGTSPTVPDKITLFQRNIESVCRTDGELRHRILEVLFHEIGHYFGMSEKEIRKAMKHFQ